MLGQGKGPGRAPTRFTPLGTPTQPERSSLERHYAWVTVPHGGQRSRGAEIRYPQGTGTIMYTPLVLHRLPPPPNTMMNRLSITKVGVFRTCPSHQNPHGADYKVLDVGATPLCPPPSTAWRPTGWSGREAPYPEARACVPGILAAASSVRAP